MEDFSRDPLMLKYACILIFLIFALVWSVILDWRDYKKTKK